jgi:hypothetical protein
MSAIISSQRKILVGESRNPFKNKLHILSIFAEEIYFATMWEMSRNTFLPKARIVGKI